MESHRGRSFPTWVVFDNYIQRKDPDSFREDDPEIPSARSRASNGDDVLVSFRLVAPPAASHLYLHYPREGETFRWASLLAADLDSVLFRVVAPSGAFSTSYPWCCHTDYFVCKAGPSGLSIYGPLPPCYIDGRRWQGRAMPSVRTCWRYGTLVSCAAARSSSLSQISRCSYPATMIPCRWKPSSSGTVPLLAPSSGRSREC